MVLRIVILLALFVGSAKAATNVSGVLLNNAVWSSSGSANPYYLVNDVQIPRNVTLTIQPGVIINYSKGDFEIFIKGVIQIQGTSSQPVVFQGGSIYDLKYMVNFQCAQLPNSFISYAQFKGPKAAVRIENAPVYLQQNTGTLVIQSSTFLDNTQIASNTVSPPNNDPSVPALELRMCSLTQTKVSTANTDSGPIRLINSTIFYGTFYPRTAFQSIQIINSIVRNLTVIYDNGPGQFQLISSNLINATTTTQGYANPPPAFTVIQSVVRDMLFIFGLNGDISPLCNLTFRDSTMFNISVSSLTGYGWWWGNNAPGIYISNCKFTLGTVVLNYRSDYNMVLIEDSTITKVNISTADSNNGYGDTQVRGTLTIRNTTFTDGALNTPSLTVTILYSTITLVRLPFGTSANSLISCSSVGRSGLIVQTDTIGLSATGLTLSKSTIKNFAVGIQINAPNINTVTISKSNFQSISQILIDNQGPYNVMASNNYWGTNNGGVINTKILDYWDDIHRGEVIYTSFSANPLSAEAGCVPYGQIDPDTLTTYASSSDVPSTYASYSDVPSTQASYSVVPSTYARYSGASSTYAPYWGK